MRPSHAVLTQPVATLVLCLLKTHNLGLDRFLANGVQWCGFLWEFGAIDRNGRVIMGDWPPIPKAIIEGRRRKKKMKATYIWQITNQVGR
jgi:hypothetical protein